MIEHPCYCPDGTCQCANQRYHFETGDILQGEFVIVPAVEPALSEYGGVFETAVLEVYQEGGAEELTATHAFAGC